MLAYARVCKKNFTEKIFLLTKEDMYIGDKLGFCFWHIKTTHNLKREN